MNQCITVCRRTVRYSFVHYSALFLCTSSVFHSANLYSFMLHFFYVAFFSCWTFFILHHFYVALSFVLHSFYVLLYFMLHFNTLQYFRFGFFPSCTIYILHFFFCCPLLILYYLRRCNQEPQKHLTWRALQ